MEIDPNDPEEIIDQREWLFYRDLHRKRRRQLGLSLFVLLIIGGIGLGIDWSIGSRLFSSANRDLGPPPEDIPYTSYSIPSESGTQVACWYAEVENAKATIVLAHRIRSSRIDMLERAKFLFEAGYSVLLIDLQAHGESIGEQITFGYLEKFDVQAAVADIKQKNPNERIVVIGNSLGASAALLAWPLDVDAMVLESVCPSVKKSIINRFDSRLDSTGKYLARFITWQFKHRVGVGMGQVSPLAKIREVTCPILILSGQEDQKATVHDAQRMFKAALASKQMEIIPKATQADLYQQDPELYEQLVLEFLRTSIRNRLKGPTESDLP